MLRICSQIEKTFNYAGEVALATQGITGITRFPSSAHERVKEVWGGKCISSALLLHSSRTVSLALERYGNIHVLKWKYTSCSILSYVTENNLFFTEPAGRKEGLESAT